MAVRAGSGPGRHFGLRYNQYPVRDGAVRSQGDRPLAAPQVHLAARADPRSSRRSTALKLDSARAPARASRGLHGPHHRRRLPRQIPNRFQLVLCATYRARMLSQGHAPKVETKNKPASPRCARSPRRDRHRDAAQGSGLGTTSAARAASSDRAMTPFSALNSRHGRALRPPPSPDAKPAARKRPPPPASAAAAPADAAAASFAALTVKLDYLDAGDNPRVRDAYRFSDEAHLGQFPRQRRAVHHPSDAPSRGLCAEWKLDAQAIMAALMHYAMETAASPGRD